MSNHNYCSLVWNFSNAQLLSKIENLQKGAYASCETITVALKKIWLFKYEYKEIGNTVHRSL